jgi:hypothetical protein
MHDAPEGNGQQAADPLGDRLRMSEGRLRKTRERGSSTSSSSPMAKVSESPSLNGNGSEPTHIAPVVNLDSWLSSQEAASYFTSPRAPEAEIEATLTITLTTYGRQEHMLKLVQANLHQMRIRGIEITAAWLSDKPNVAIGSMDLMDKFKDNRGRSWTDPKYNASTAVIPGE